LNEFQDLFVEARMCIDDLNDSVGTTYYDEDAEEAREAVETAVGNFQALLKEITDIEQKNRVLRSNGLKVEQLKGELELTLKGGH
jgi:Mg2+/Co2+ transporter CorC